MTDNLIQIATPILTVIGVFVAAYGIMRNTENAKKRATIDMIMAERNSRPSRSHNHSKRAGKNRRMHTRHLYIRYPGQEERP
ncbi:hypothetical protein Q4Q15_10395 [Neisseria gonorrhoeae]|nr:hypothetical protein [Neisseria gonorrhoeae]